MKEYNNSFILKVLTFYLILTIMFIESSYTVEWERRIFKKIGEYLRRNNITIHKCFNLIDEDNS